MLPSQRVEERIKILNTALVPLLRGARRYLSIWSQLQRISKKPLATYTTSDYTVTIFLAEMPGSNPLLIAYYISTQTSRPLSPSQVLARIKRIGKEIKKLRNRVFTAADILYILYAPRGFTKGARKISRAKGINLATTPKDLLSPVARYIAKRFNKLLEKIRGKRIWGNLPLLVYALQEIGASIGANTERVLDTLNLIKLVEQGGTLSYGQ